MSVKLDNRIRVLIENSVRQNFRSLFVIVGENSREQVPTLHHILAKTVVKARPSVLWCYKIKPDFSTNYSIMSRKRQKKKSAEIDYDNPFQVFITSTAIRFCAYKDSHKILGNTFSICVLQDFEALTANLLARTVETVEGGGMIIFLLNSVTSIKQLYTMAMDVHSRYRTEAHCDVVARFNERFILSLGSCPNALFVDESLNLLPLTSHVEQLNPVDVSKQVLEARENELKQIMESLKEVQPVGPLVKKCRTVDQAKALLTFIDVITDHTFNTTVAMTAARGRGKSATLGLAIAAAIASGYSNIFVTSPSPDNLKTLFEFVFIGLEEIGYEKHTHYHVSAPQNTVTSVNVFRHHRQSIKYVPPTESLGQADFLCIDEAAAIPLPLVEALIGPYVVFMSSTVSGYEGTGRSLSLKLISRLRKSASSASKTGRGFREVELAESIRYAVNDPVEAWLGDLLCFNSPKTSSLGGFPSPDNCELYYVHRDSLFSYHKTCEKFLRRIVSLFVSSHYKNSPNDLQMLADAPAHHIFVLTSKVESSSKLPNILCAIQVVLEGGISRASTQHFLARGKVPFGDLIPWTLSQQFLDSKFTGLSGVRVVRIATDPECQNMGYGQRAISLLTKYYSGAFPLLSKPCDIREEQDSSGLKTDMPPLLMKMTERQAEAVDYVGVSYGLCSQLFRFWTKCGFRLVYIRQSKSPLTGEYSSIFLRPITPEFEKYIPEFYNRFRQRFLPLLSYEFRNLEISLVATILGGEESRNGGVGMPEDLLTRDVLSSLLNEFDMKRLEEYSRNMAEYSLIKDLMPVCANMCLDNRRLVNLRMTDSQLQVMVGLGLQHLTVEQVEKQLDMPAHQILGFVTKSIKKLCQVFAQLDEVEEEQVDEPVITVRSIEAELDEQQDIMATQERTRRNLESLSATELEKCTIKGDEELWNQVTTKFSPAQIVTFRNTDEFLATKRKMMSNDLIQSVSKPRKKKKHK